jgi:hypothetical protein
MKMFKKCSNKSNFDYNIDILGSFKKEFAKKEGEALAQNPYSLRKLAKKGTKIFSESLITEAPQDDNENNNDDEQGEQEKPEAAPESNPETEEAPSGQENDNIPSSGPEGQPLNGGVPDDAFNDETGNDASGEPANMQSQEGSEPRDDSGDMPADTGKEENGFKDNLLTKALKGGEEIGHRSDELDDTGSISALPIAGTTLYSLYDQSKEKYAIGDENQNPLTDFSLLYVMTKKDERSPFIRCISSDGTKLAYDIGKNRLTTPGRIALDTMKPSDIGEDAAGGAGAGGAGATAGTGTGGSADGSGSSSGADGGITPATPDSGTSSTPDHFPSYGGVGMYLGPLLVPSYFKNFGRKSRKHPRKKSKKR